MLHSASFFLSLSLFLFSPEDVSNAHKKHIQYSTFPLPFLGLFLFDHETLIRVSRKFIECYENVSQPKRFRCLSHGFVLSLFGLFTFSRLLKTQMHKKKLKGGMNRRNKFSYFLLLSYISN